MVVKTFSTAMPDTHRWDYIISPFSNVRDYDVATESLARLPPETPERFERAAQLMSRISGDTITCIAAELFEEKVALEDPEALASRPLSSSLLRILNSMEGKASAEFVVPPSTDNVKRAKGGILLCSLCENVLQAQCVGALATVHMQVCIV